MPFRYRNFRLFFLARFAFLCAHHCLIVVLGQAVYELTHDPLQLGLIGLAIFLPRFGFAIVGGHVADRYHRQTIIACCRAAQIAVGVGIALAGWYGFQPLWVLYALLFIGGTATAFDGPASQALLPSLIAEHELHTAVAWSATAMQAAMVLGPVLGGLLYSVHGDAHVALVVVVALRVVSAVCTAVMRVAPTPIDRTAFSWERLLAGLRYVFTERVLLAVISLDLFAVLFGGAVALLPIYANDILHVGARGLGWLRAAPAVGALGVAVWLAGRAHFRHPGVVMLWCVALFGLATLVFGGSRNFALSLAALTVLGGADMVSVVVRGVLVQVRTPPAMRGRVSAVNLVFIGASNELGEFESGLTAKWFGTVPAVLLGASATLAIAALWARWFPELRALRGDDVPRHDAVESAERSV
ncbi:MAG: MFS transporter [Deltaproteobacteria bacterium]|nr:MFS transporter [Deltaproteobacteria bacterium]